MDPTQAYKDFCRALLEEDASRARESYNAVRVWLDKGGFEPSWTPAERRQFFTFDPSTGRLS